MHRLRVYIDNSVFGGVFDEEFAEDSRRLFDLIRAGRYTVLVCGILIEEIAFAPQRVRDVFTSLPAECVEEIPVDAEVEELADAYLKAGAVAEKWRDDAAQIAAATVARADLLLSWNYKHIVNLDRIRVFNGVNVSLGYGPIEIRSPREVGHADDE